MTTNIEWARNPDGSKGETWPVVTGCTPVGEGCRMCYAARMAATRLKHHPRYEGLATIENGKARWTGKVRLNRDVLEQPLHWVKSRMVFVCSMSDLFHPSVPDEFIGQVFQMMYECPQHTFQVLTKRPERMCQFMQTGRYLRNRVRPIEWIWLGVSVENQAAADERIPLLLRTPAAVRFVSVEPLLAPVDLSGKLQRWCEPKESGMIPGLDWVICGGESGPGARPMHPDWVRSLRDQCQAADVPFFFKQWGEFAPESHWRDFSMAQRNRKGAVFSFRDRRFPQDQRMYKVGKKTAGHLLDGCEHQEFPRRE